MDLIVGLAVRESEQLGLDLQQEQRLFRKQHKAGLELGLLNVEPPDLVALDRDRLDVKARSLTQLLGECDAGGSVLDQYRSGLEAIGKRQGGVA